MGFPGLRPAFWLALPCHFIVSWSAMPDTASHVLFHSYQEAYAKASQFFEPAHRSNIKVQPEEIASRMAVYEGLYPGQQMDPRAVERLLQAEKYLATQGKSASPRDVEDRLAEWTAMGRTFEEGNLEAVRQAIRSELLFKDREVQHLGEKVMELTILQNQEKMDSAWTLWPLESLRLKASPDECLAGSEGDCRISVEEFNAILGEYRVPRVLNRDTARVTALRKYLLDKQLAGNVPFPDSGHQVDSLVAATKQRNSGMQLTSQTRGMGRQVQDPQILMSTYDRYYRELFKAKTVAGIGLIASSDSAYIDSAYRAMEAWRKADSAARKAGRSAAPEPALPWTTYPEETLPRIISLQTDTLHPKEFTRPIKTNLGYFLARVQELKRIKEVSFQEAYPKLVFLATRDKFLAMDSVIDARSLKYYRKHPEEFRIPDTLALTAWLLPFQPVPRHAKHPPDPSPRPGKDSLAYPWLRITSLWLPENLQRQLSKLAREYPAAPRKKAGKPFFGPLKGEYGEWYFRVDSVRKAGGLRAFAAVKRDIVLKLVTPEIEPDTLARDSVKKAVLRNIGLARLQATNIARKWSTLPDGEITRLIQSGEIDTAGLSIGSEPEGREDILRHKLAEKQSRSDLSQARTSLNHLVIDYAKLFAP